MRVMPRALWAIARIGFDAAIADSRRLRDNGTALMTIDYETLLAKAAYCEQLAKVAHDRSIREKSAELAREYREKAERLRVPEAA